MDQVVSITSQGQLTIPKSFLIEMGIVSSTKAVISKKGSVLTVKPRKDFWSLGGSLKSKVILSDAELEKAREGFSEYWAKND
jgi:bifunctional DNA-binding transcriptional regulator/antitoxin component of YhaV-PrlF toxin-antitoxin module